MLNVAFWVLELSGAAVLLTSVAALYMFLVDEFFEWRHEPHQRSFYEGTQHVRNALANDAWWFSESPETQQLLQELSRGLEISTVRDNWRRRRAVCEQVNTDGARL